MATLSAGIVLAVTFFGLGIIALSVRGARGIGGLHRQLARSYLGEEIEDPEAFSPRPGFLGWLQSSLRDRTGWRSMAYVGLKVPLAVVGILVGFACWWDAFFCLTFPVWGGSGSTPGGLRAAPDHLRSAASSPVGRPASSMESAVFSGRSGLLLRGPVGGAGRRQSRPAGPAGPVGSRSRGRCGCAPSSRPGPRPSTPRRRRCDGSSATSTTAPRPNWSPWPCASGWPRRN